MNRLSAYQAPGVYKEEHVPTPQPLLMTGVPAFLGYTEQGDSPDPELLTHWSHYVCGFGSKSMTGYLAHAIRGFFENGGRRCYVVRLNREVDVVIALTDGLKSLEALTDIDLVCAPDIYAPLPHGTAPNHEIIRVMQMQVLSHCEQQRDRFAILDAWSVVNLEEVLEQRKGLGSRSGALYFPWVQTIDTAGSEPKFVPPCGHIAGVYARTDEQVGVHKAPANEPLHGVLDLQTRITDPEQSQLNREGVNCLRSFPGRGIRVWGARTLSRQSEWRYINVRRLFLTVHRWVEQSLTWVTFERSEPHVWARVSRELTGYLTELYRRGWLKGRTAREALFVKCDGETNPLERREAGELVTEVGLAPTVPNEFLVVRLIHNPSGALTAEMG